MKEIFARSILVLALCMNVLASYDCGCTMPSDDSTCICGYQGNSDGYTDYSGGDHKKNIKGGDTIKMNFYCKDNGFSSWVYHVDIKHKGSDITCAVDKCPASSGDPFVVECTNWSTTTKHIYVDHFECSDDKYHGECSLRRNLLEENGGNLRGRDLALANPSIVNVVTDHTSYTNQNDSDNHAKKRRVESITVERDLGKCGEGCFSHSECGGHCSHCDVGVCRS